MKRCVFCGATYSAEVYVCRTCNDYKGLEEVSVGGLATLSTALNSAFALMEEERKAFADDCEHENLSHTCSSAHLAFCPDCDLEFQCECAEGKSHNPT